MGCLTNCVCLGILLCGWDYYILTCSPHIPVGCSGTWRDSLEEDSAFLLCSLGLTALHWASSLLTPTLWKGTCLCTSALTCLLLSPLSYSSLEDSLLYLLSLHTLSGRKFAPFSGRDWGKALLLPPAWEDFFHLFGTLTALSPLLSRHYWDTGGGHRRTLLYCIFCCTFSRHFLSGTHTTSRLPSLLWEICTCLTTTTALPQDCLSLSASTLSTIPSATSFLFFFLSGSLPQG